MIDPHVTIEPSILYLGTLVVFISTQNEDGTANLAPMSSAWWLGWRCMLGLQTAPQTPQNMIRTGQCVLNLALPKQAGAVNRLARLTGTKGIPELKQKLGYTYEPRKFEVAGLSIPAGILVVRGCRCRSLRNQSDWRAGNGAWCLRRASSEGRRESPSMHIVNQPSILDLGTPVALLCTVNESETLYLAAVTSMW